MAVAIKVGTSASANKGVTGRRSLKGGRGQFVTRRQKYGQIRQGLGLSGG
jgi:hypothetical protein